MCSRYFRVFPYDLMKSARDGYNELRARLEGWTEYSRRDANADRTPIRRLSETHEGVNLITRVAAGGQLSVRRSNEYFGLVFRNEEQNAITKSHWFSSPCSLSLARREAVAMGTKSLAGA